MTRCTVTTGQASIDTCVDGHGPSVVIVPSYGRDAGSDFDPLTTALVEAGYRVLRPQPRAEWGDLRARYCDRVTTTVIDDASHALFPEQPEAVAAAVVHHLRGPRLRGLG